MEVLLVLVILVMLAGFAVTALTGTRDRAERQAAQTQVGLLERAAKQFEFDMRRWPGSFEELIQAPSDQTSNKWAGPYLELKAIPLDPWDNQYQIASPGQRNPSGIDIWSMGPDRTSGSEDDIGNWTTNIVQQ
jgi:general secretion pathway protein G